MSIIFRQATPYDIPTLKDLICESATSLCVRDYSTTQIEACIGTVFGVDESLINDGTYFVAESDRQIIGCGGWGKRHIPFGISTKEGRLLEAETDAAKIRCFFVKAGWERRHIAKSLMTKCEQEVQMHGFREIELTATLTGRTFYEKCGYQEIGRVMHPLREDLMIEFIKMKKKLA